MASSGMAVLPSFRMGVTSTGSHLMGAYEVDLVSCWRVLRRVCDDFFTLAASKISLTD